MLITFLTDFGLADSYVGTMKGVALRIAPQAQLIDISHLLPPQDILAAAVLLPEYVPYFPSGTVHVVVVDPGVGSARRGLALEVTLAGARHTVVAPDNGLIGPLLEMVDQYQVVELREARYWLPQLSSTFHGRDVFTPVAAHLAQGLALSALGPPLAEPLRCELPQARHAADGTISGSVLTIDHFGNALSSIRGGDLAAGTRYRAWLNDAYLGPLCRTFADVDPGMALAYLGSSGRVEVALRNGNAAADLGIVRGMALVLRPIRSASEDDCADWG